VSAERRSPWDLLGQLSAAGLEVSVPHRNGWVFSRGKLFAHICPATACADCTAARKAGYRTYTVTAEKVRDGRALDEIGALLWHPVQGDLFR